MDLKTSINNLRQKVRTFFSTFPWKNLFTFLFFLLLSFIFWLMLYSQRHIEGTYRIPLKYTNIPEDIVFDEPLPEYIEIRVTDNGYQIFKYDLSKKDSIEINISEFRENNIDAIQGNRLIQLIRTQLAPTTELLSYSPAIISLGASKLESKKLPVVFDGEITTSGGNLVIDSITLIPKTVTAYASKKQLAQLNQAITEYTVFENLKATSQFKVKIKKIEGIKFVPQEIDILIHIKEYTEKNFEIPITCSNLPKNLDVKFFPSHINVTFSVTLEEYNTITPEDFEIDLDYNELKSNQEGKIEVNLTKSPPSILNPRLSPSIVEFLFEKQE